MQITKGYRADGRRTAIVEAIEGDIISVRVYEGANYYISECILGGNFKKLKEGKEINISDTVIIDYVNGLDLPILTDILD